MIPGICIKIQTKKFPVLEGEEDEIVNDGMYGMALCQYLELQLPKVGINVPTFFSEDWGWWLEVVHGEFSMGLCIYSDPDAAENPEKYAVMSSISSEKKWSWSQFRKIDVSSNVTEIINRLEQVFRADSDIVNVTRHDDYPF